MPVERILVWNLGFNTKTERSTGTSRRQLLSHLIDDLRPSIVALQEAPEGLRIKGGLKKEAGPGNLFTAFDPAIWQRTERREFLRRAVGLGLIHCRSGREIFLWNLHLPSLLNGNTPSNQRAYVRDRFKPEFESSRKAGRSDVLVGDFNLPPYDEVVMAPGGFWANRSLHDALEHARNAVTPQLPLFNPSWELFGNHTAPCGTYYLTQRLDGEGPWHVIDQALMSPELATPGSSHVRLISSVRATSLCGADAIRVPLKEVGSDHLPFQVTIDVA